MHVPPIVCVRVIRSWIRRPESHASKQIRRCQLVAVVLISLVTAAVIILFLAGERGAGVPLLFELTYIGARFFC